MCIRVNMYVYMCNVCKAYRVQYTVVTLNKGHVGTRVLSFIERCPLFGG